MAGNQVAGTEVAENATQRAQSRPRIVAFPPSISPKPAPEIVTRFHHAIVTAIAGTGSDAIDPLASMSSSEKATASGCRAASCFDKMVAPANANAGVSVRITSIGKNYTVDVALRAGGSSIGQIQQTCPICTLNEVIEACEKTVAAAINRAFPRATAASDTKTPDIQNANGTPETPTITPTKPSETPVKSATNRTAVANATAQRDNLPELDKNRPQTGITDKSGLSLWPIIVSGSAATVLLAVGIPLIAVDGKAVSCRGTPRPDYHNCSRVIATGSAGWTTTAFGIAALSTTGILLYLYLRGKLPDGSKERASDASSRRYLSVFPTSRGMGAVVGATF